MDTSIMKRKTFCVITGASQGFGRVIAEDFASSLAGGSTLLLLARQVNKLQDVKKCISSANPNIAVLIHEFDQSKLCQCERSAISSMLDHLKVSVDGYEQLLIVHNAGIIGDVTKFATQLSDACLVENAMAVNVSGVILLNASFLSVFTSEVVKQRIVVNVSSLGAIQAIPSWSLYCSGKAARDMFFQTLAKEDSSVRVLNYAPGPLDTDMQKSCRECAHDATRQMFIDLFNNGGLLTCRESVAKLIKLLQDNTFESGAHIDFYDV